LHHYYQTTQIHLQKHKPTRLYSTKQEDPIPCSETFYNDLNFAQNSRASPDKVEIPLPKEAERSFVPGMNKEDDMTAKIMY
jgi:plastocyanin domain-containing protein